MEGQIVRFKKGRPFRLPYILQNPNLMWMRKDHRNHTEYVYNESLEWLHDTIPLWSRLNKRNASGQYRSLTTSKIRNYDIEIEGMLYSLWGNAHLDRDVINKQLPTKPYLGCCVVALCISCIYPVGIWTPQILDSTILNGERYYEQSLLAHNMDTTMSHRGQENKFQLQLSIRDLYNECWLDGVKFNVHIELITTGKLYCQPSLRKTNLAEALMYFFEHFHLGLLSCQKRHLAFGFVPGPDGGYFLYDCQSSNAPLFQQNRGSTYVLLTKNLQLLLYCLVVTLNVRLFHQTFSIYNVDINLDSKVRQPPLTSISIEDSNQK